jgi:hypothetical protein
MSPMNPFSPSSDADRHYIWDRVIVADSEAFAMGDWNRIANDFDAENFEGIRCYTNNPNDWRLVFPSLDSYRISWLDMAKEFAKKKFFGRTNLEAIYARCRIDQIEIVGDRALVHKKFSGTLDLADGSKLSGSRQTIYRLHRRDGVWKIVGFLGYLPLEE